MKKKAISLDKIPVTAMPMELDILHGSDYANALDMLFHDDEFKKRVAHRQRMFNVASRPGANATAIRVGIQHDDRIIADTILTLMVRMTLEQKSEEDVKINDLWKKVPADKQELKVKCSYALDTVSFLADVIESKLVDIESYLREMFADVEESYSFKMFDGVKASLKQLSSYFHGTRDTGSTEEQELFCDYADSMEAYIDKRMKTYSEKLLAIKKREKKVKK